MFGQKCKHRELTRGVVMTSSCHYRRKDPMDSTRFGHRPGLTLSGEPETAAATKVGAATGAPTAASTTEEILSFGDFDDDDKDGVQAMAAVTLLRKSAYLGCPVKAGEPLAGEPLHQHHGCGFAAAALPWLCSGCTGVGNGGTGLGGCFDPTIVTGPHEFTAGDPGGTGFSPPAAVPAPATAATAPVSAASAGSAAPTADVADVPAAPAVALLEAAPPTATSVPDEAKARRGPGGNTSGIVDVAPKAVGEVAERRRGTAHGDGGGDDRESAAPPVLAAAAPVKANEEGSSEDIERRAQEAADLKLAQLWQADEEQAKEAEEAEDFQLAQLWQANEKQAKEAEDSKLAEDWRRRAGQRSKDEAAQSAASQKFTVLERRAAEASDRNVAGLEAAFKKRATAFDDAKASLAAAVRRKMSENTANERRVCQGTLDVVARSYRKYKKAMQQAQTTHVKKKLQLAEAENRKRDANDAKTDKEKQAKPPTMSNDAKNKSVGAAPSPAQLSPAQPQPSLSESPSTTAAAARAAAAAAGSAAGAAPADTGAAPAAATAVAAAPAAAAAAAASGTSAAAAATVVAAVAATGKVTGLTSRGAWSPSSPYSRAWPLARC